MKINNIFIILAAVVASILWGIAPVLAESNPAEDAEFQRKAQFASEHRRVEGEMKTRLIPPEIDADSVHSWDAVHYDIEMEFFPDDAEVSAVVTITGFSNEAELDSVPMHFYPGMTIENVLCGGAPTGYLWEDDDLTVELDGIYAQGDTFEITVSYNGTPSMIYDPNAIGGMGVFWGNVIYSYTDPEGARAWFPCFDKPYDKASYSARYTLPEGWVMASNGNLDSTVVNPNNTITYCWTHDYPIETYLISIAASNYAQFDTTYSGIPIEYYVYPGHLGAAQADFQQMPDMMECYELNYGEYPFEKYGMAEAPIFGGFGGMEHQTMTTIGSGLITGTGAYEFIFCHELSHMWFGDAISLIDWPHMWLNEGFATYSEAIWAYSNYGWYYFLYYVQNYIQNVYMNWENSFNRHPIYDPPSGYLFSPVEYEKAASVLHMLRYYMGDLTFFNVLREYYLTYRYGCASTDDFQEVCESVSGLDLEWFFQQWIYDEGYPVFEYFAAADSVAPSTYRISVGISQTQEQSLPAFMTDIDIAIFADGQWVDTNTVWVEERIEEFVYEFIGPEPDSIVLDPESWILGRKIFQGNVTGPAFSYIDYEWETEFLSPGSSSGLVVTLLNSGISVEEVIGNLTTEDPDLNISSGQSGFGYAGFMTTFSNADDPFTVELDASAEPHWAQMQLTLEWLGGDTILDFSAPVGDPTILFVDDDEGAVNDTCATDILDSLGMVYRHWDVFYSGQPADLGDYEGVIWYCGHAGNTLSGAEIDLLSDYLDANGRLFISGTNIASDLAGDDFLPDYLGIEFGTEVVIPIIMGVPGDPIGGGLSIYLNSQPPDQDSVAAVNGGVVCFNYTGNKPCGVHKENGYKAVTFAFSFDDIRWDNPNFSMPDEVLWAVLNWLDVTVEVDQPFVEEGLPGGYRLLGCYPNPFNNTTTITFTLEGAMPVKLTVYDILGREVVVLVDGEMSAGRHRVEWRAGNNASGIYFVKCSTIEGAQIRKVVLLK